MRAAIGAIALAISCSPVFAQSELFNEKVAQWGDPFTPPQTRVRCISESWGRWPWGGEWRTCNAWATDTKNLQIVVTLIVTGPDGRDDAARNLVRNCKDVAVAAAVATFFGTPSPELYARLVAAKEMAEKSFVACISSGSIIGVFDFKFVDSYYWSKWSNEKSDAAGNSIGRYAGEAWSN